MTLPSSSPSAWNAEELELKATLPPSVASDPGLSAEVRQIGGENCFVFTDALGCRLCADANLRKHTECLVRVEGYLKFLRWIVGDMSESQRPSKSACLKCSKEHKPFCRFKCIDTILGSEWSTRDIGSTPPIDPTLSPRKRRRKKNDGSVAASSKRPRRASPAKSVRIIRAAPADSTAIDLPPITQPTPSHAADSASLNVNGESNDLLDMIVKEFDLNHLIGDKIDVIYPAGGVRSR